MGERMRSCSRCAREMRAEARKRRDYSEMLGLSRSRDKAEEWGRNSTRYAYEVKFIEIRSRDSAAR